MRNLNTEINYMYKMDDITNMKLFKDKSILDSMKTEIKK
jgi:hypothetical protein